jgi:hypothetical protein
MNQPLVTTRRTVEVLKELVRGSVVWQARRSGDRGRLQVVAIVPAATEPTVVETLSETDLRELLAPVPTPTPAGWVCAECGATNEPGRRWCRVCSAHEGGSC